MACIKGIQRILTWSIMLLNTGVTPRTEICGNPIPRIPSNLIIDQRLKGIITTIIKINTITTIIKSIRINIAITTIATTISPRRNKRDAGLMSCLCKGLIVDAHLSKEYIKIGGSRRSCFLSHQNQSSIKD